jgi:myo-inositol-1-phosphate synthase
MMFAQVPVLDAPVFRGPTLDGLGTFYRSEIDESEAEPVDVARVLRDHDVDVLVSYLPVGSEQATRHYIERALEAGVAVVNCIPVFIASDPEWERRFKEANLPIVGDDIKSQVGATIVHRQLAKLFEDRGITIDHTYQLNFGGNMDFRNMLERERLASKKLSKTNAVRSNVSQELEDRDIHIGPSDHVPWLDDRKWAYIRLEGHGFGGAPMSVEMKLEVWDSPNSAGVVVDAVRCCKLAIDRGVGGALVGPSAYFMKSPPVQYPDDLARQMTEDFIETETRPEIPE